MTGVSIQIRSFHRPSTAVLDIFGNNHSMRRFIPWLFNLDADLQNSHSIVAGLLWSTNFLAAPFQPHFNPARKRTFQEGLRALFISGTAVSGKYFVITVSNLVPRASLGPEFQSDSKMVAAPYLTWAGGICQHKGWTIIFPGGIVIGKKNCLHEEWKKFLKKLSAPEVHLEKCLQRPPSMLCKIWEILKKLSAQLEWRKNLQVLNR